MVLGVCTKHIKQNIYLDVKPTFWILAALFLLKGNLETLLLVCGCFTDLHWLLLATSVPFQCAYYSELPTV